VSVPQFVTPAPKPAAPTAPAPAPQFTPLKRDVGTPKREDNFGFYEVAATPTESIVISTWGLEKCGKTNIALTAPGDIVYMNANYGDAGVVDKFLGKKKVFRYDIEQGKWNKGMSKADTMALYVPIWERFKEAWFHALDRKLGRTYVIDTADEIYELIRLARLGAITQVMPEHYGPVYDEYESVVKAPLSYRVNAIYIHRADKEYKTPEREEAELPPAPPPPGSGTDPVFIAAAPPKGGGNRKEWTGAYVRKGYKHMANIAELNVHQYRTPTNGFGLKIESCRNRPELDGIHLADEKNAAGVFVPSQCTFQFLAMLANPNTDPKVWL